MLKFIKCFVLIFFLCNFIYLTNANAATINAASCEQEDVRAAIDAAVSGDTVTVPAGSCTWATQMNITKGIRLAGPGRDKLTITSGYNWDGSRYKIDDFLVTYVPIAPEDDDPFDISGFTWDMDNLCGFLFVDAGSIYKLSKIRVFSNTIINARRNTFSFNGQSYGVIYENTITNGTDTYAHISPYGDNAYSWTNLTFTPGDADKIYLEDNIMQFHQMNNDGGLGGRIAVRYNTVTWGGTNSSGVFTDAHGNAGNHAAMGTELYGNYIDWNNFGGGLIGLRGGIAIVAYNKQVNNTNPRMGISEERADNITPPATGPTGQPQHISGSYFWRNYNTSTLMDTSWTHECCSGSPGQYGPDPDCCYNNGGADGILEDVDFFADDTSFDGTGGVGCGTVAQMNAITPTTDNVGFWATDQSCTDLTDYTGRNPTTSLSGTLYRWDGDSWEAYFTPYTYPHPLRQTAITGDVTGDSLINIQDIQACVNHILGTQDWGDAADVNEDSAVNVLDVQEIVNIILGG